MPRFNRQGVTQVGPTSPVQTTEEREYTHEGHKGWVRTPKSELFLLACSFMGGDDNFYEKSEDRYARLVSLVNDKSVYSDIGWLCGFVYWLRRTANMRTVALVIAAEAVVARLANDLTEPVMAGWLVDEEPIQASNRNLISAAMQRADEPAEMIAYWNHKHGGLLPQPFKAGIGDAVKRLYNEFSVLKYGASRTASVTAKDVLRVTHPKPVNDAQAGLFGWITGAATVVGPETLPMLWNRKVLSEIDRENRNLLSGYQVELIRGAGFTWENLSEWNPEGMNARAWEVMIPRMGIFALLRNLRNFDQVGISDDAVAMVQNRLSFPGAIRKSGILPFQVYGAFRAVESMRWGSTLDSALTQCCDNIPRFDGDTLVLVDMSQSMWFSTVSAKSALTYADAAGVFAAALKVANPNYVDLWQFGSEYQSQWNHEYQAGPWVGERSANSPHTYSWRGVTKQISATPGASVLSVMGKIHCMGGTKIHQAFMETYRPGKHKRIIILTDEQGFNSQWADSLAVPDSVPIYVWNFAGYRASVMQVGEKNRHTMGGLTDDSFKMIPILEAGRNASWPWETRPDGPGPVAHGVHLSHSS